ncbi:MAG: EAL domain-containing protein, partial [Methylosarcina sp.]
GMAHTLRLKVLAEGVETEEQLNFLRIQGCDFYQGYYKSPALSAEDFATFVQKEASSHIPENGS